MSTLTDTIDTKAQSFKSKQWQLSHLRNYFPDKHGLYLPSIFPLGYYVRRSEPRLLYVMPLTMIYDGVTYPVKSKNVSINGVLIFMPRTFILEGKTVQLTFDKFVKSQSTSTNLIEEYANFEQIDYRIKEVQHMGEKTYVSLIQQTLSIETMDYLRRFIAGNRLRYKIDATDRVYASKAQYYENLYTINMQHVPLFICWNKKYGLYIDTIIKTNRNTQFFDYLTGKDPKNKGKPDFRPFCLPLRIEKFAELARENQSALLFTYWENGKLHSVFDFEFQSEQYLGYILVKVKAHNGRIFKTSTNLNKKPVAEKVTSMLGKIQVIDTMASKIIEKHTSEAIAQIILTDISQILLRQSFFAQDLRFIPGKTLALNLLCGHQHVRMTDGHVLQSYDDELFHLPDIINFDISHQRYDARYQYEMDVSITFNGKTYPARTLDFSRTGLGLVIKNRLDIEKDSHLDITFSGLQNKGITDQLNNISHRVMVARSTKDGIYIGAVRNTTACEPEVNHFFAKLVKRNQDKLELCVKDKVDSVSTTFYEAYVTENIQTIPIVITRDREKKHYIREVGLTDTPCKLAEKIYIKGQGYDFRFLTTENRLNELHHRVIKATEKNAQSFMLFLFKGHDEQDKEAIFSITDFELDQDDQIEDVIRITLEQEGACIRVQFMNQLLIDTLYRKMTLDKVAKLNKASAQLLNQEYKEIIGFAEMLDLTDEYQKQYENRMVSCE